MLLGILFHTIGGIASGSFYMPFKKVKAWSWEVFWLFGGLFSWLIAPFVAAWLTVPDFNGIIGATEGHVKAFTYLMGLLWGIGG
ncbi:MAG TPA: rhamnose/proton symporter RhaT, partial [Saprospirales bacterium]|nr:rhamnose/proton symporter RhaT [Saprospirales bacterium]